MRAFVFPGQGSQKIGMGSDLAEASSAARDVFEEVDDALGEKLSAIMRNGPEDQLTLTQNAQPAIMANSLAIVRVLQDEFGVSLVEKGEYVAGHSLGEYSALCATGAFSLAETARLLRLRGQAMQAAVPVGIGAMCALLGTNVDTAGKLADAAAQGEVCTVANDNDPTQVVLSGHVSAIERAIGMAKEFGARRAVLLPVSAPFHCELMAPAARAMEDALAIAAPAPPHLPLFANVTAQPVADADQIRRLLVEQVTGRVRWRESAMGMAAAGVTHFVELGGKVLSPMIARSTQDCESRSIVTMQDCETLAKEL
ncbi:ACP S-malonyltransferase [Croceicoccus sp. F390]|uniref:Malonyl CoA-acyl carrier protein transacylase n=1 Tax=Croceicoccus esteveae TaxID=3075597 RepID=A0ABU2ZFE9_9SPHN|nr:ACP S-malonyltransferase [Croceicoccus sp. F390]MDT0574803.1 ACP S-malonyltransferase [Croceicoccus sp. F390]